MITFYGHFTGDSSFPVVCRAIADWFDAHGRDVQLRNLRGPAHRPTPGTALLWGFPDWVHAIPKHDVLIGYHVCDVDRVPDHWVQCINENEHYVLTPSSWCAKVLRDCGVRHEIGVVNHGIDPEVFTLGVQVVREVPILRFLCSSPTGVRKGLPEMIAAWRILVAQGLRVELRVRHSGSSEVVKACWDVPSLTLEQADPLAPAGMAELYRETDLLVVPSRAEGFSLTPLESLACGTPVVTTACTGASEWAGDLTGGVRFVETGELAPCASPGAPQGFGRAPSLDPGCLADVIEQAVEDLEQLKAEARLESDRVRERWSWERVLTGSALDKLTSHE